MYGSEVLCLEGDEVGILHMVRAMCEVQFNYIKSTMDLILMLCLDKTMGQLDMANSVHWCGNVLKREHGYFLLWHQGFM